MSNFNLYQNKDGNSVSQCVYCNAWGLIYHQCKGCSKPIDPPYGILDPGESPRVKCDYCGNYGFSNSNCLDCGASMPAVQVTLQNGVSSISGIGSYFANVRSGTGRGLQLFEVSTTEDFSPENIDEIITLRFKFQPGWANIGQVRFESTDEFVFEYPITHKNYGDFTQGGYLFAKLMLSRHEQQVKIIVDLPRKFDYKNYLFEDIANVKFAANNVEIRDVREWK